MLRHEASHITFYPNRISEQLASLFTLFVTAGMQEVLDGDSGPQSAVKIFQNFL